MVYGKNLNSTYVPLAAQIITERGYYKGVPIKRLIGPEPMKAAARFIMDCEPGAIIAFQNTNTQTRLAVGVVQCHLRNKGFDPGKVDGWAGPQTDYALDQYMGKVEYFLDFPEPKQVWPKQADVPAFYGEKGQHQVTIKSPFPLVCAWNNDLIIEHMSVHEKVADSATRILEAIHKAYSEVQVREFGINQFGGSLNVRLMRGSAVMWSMHSWGIAQDWYPQMNQFKWGRDKAVFARPEYNAFINCFEAEGWNSLGRKKNYDWMHFQAAIIP